MFSFIVWISPVWKVVQTGFVFFNNTSCYLLKLVLSSPPDGENALQTQPGESQSGRQTHTSVIQEGRGLDHVSPPKYKSSLLHRYLNDSLHHVMTSGTDSRKRNHSDSFSSNEYEDELLSPSLSDTEANFSYRTGQSSVTFLKHLYGQGPRF